LQIILYVYQDAEHVVAKEILDFEVIPKPVTETVDKSGVHKSVIAYLRSFAFICGFLDSKPKNFTVT